MPWCLLVVGIARVALKADNLISKIGLNPAITGDPLGHGRGMMAMMMAARTIMNSASRQILIHSPQSIHRSEIIYALPRHTLMAPVGQRFLQLVHPIHLLSRCV